MKDLFNYFFTLVGLLSLIWFFSTMGILHWAILFICIIFGFAIFRDIINANKNIKRSKNNYLSFHQLATIVGSIPLYGSKNRLSQYKSCLYPSVNLFIKHEGFDLIDIITSEKKLKGFLEHLGEKYELNYTVDAPVWLEEIDLFSVIMNIDYSKNNPPTEAQITTIKEGFNNKDTIKKIISSANAKKELQHRISQTEDELKLALLSMDIKGIEILEKIYLPNN